MSEAVEGAAGFTPERQTGEQLSPGASAPWHETVDFLVVGSGGGGMAAAITAADCGARTLVVEKAASYGGSTALSGGVLWVPGNHLMKRAGCDDSPAQAMRYLDDVVPAEVDRQRLRAYVRAAPEMLRFLEEAADIRFEAATAYMDYYPERAGGKSGGRSLDPRPFSRRRLGALYRNQRRPPVDGAGLGFSVTAREAHLLLDLSWRSYLYIAKRLLQYWADIPSRLRGLPDNRLTLGQALVARLRHALHRRHVPLWLNSPLRELVVESGRVVGAVIDRGGELRRVRAERGVLLAAGGFEHNPEMRQRYHGYPCEQWSAASTDNTGDAIRIAQTVGADTEFMDCAWWTPTLKMPDGEVLALINGKSYPGSIFVNRAGRRFVNEAAPYEDVVKAQYASHGRGEEAIPAFMIFDARFRHHYAVATIAPAKAVPDRRLPASLRESDFLKKADSLEDLAAQLGIDRDGLLATVARVSAMADAGRDEDFGRGDSLHDRYYCDPNHQPNPAFGAVRQPPFYAIEVYPGDLGTKGGLRCDAHGRVLDGNGLVLPGLYATGNCSGAVMGDSYPGAGSTIGPAMTFGYLAARHACGGLQ